MSRFKLTLEYDGGPFVGWQRQGKGMSVQQALEEAMFRITGETVQVHGAGRTDAGVHALGQVAHLDVAKAIEPEKLRDAINFHVKPAPIAVLSAEMAPSEFHARFSATGRTYRYRIVNRRVPLTVDRSRAWQVVAPLDAARMHDAAQVLVGKHDFTTFRASLCQAPSPVKTVERLSVHRAGEEVQIVVEARSFLHHQVRNMVGTLRLVGEGKWTKEDVESALEARDRTRGGPTAPPDGLYLTAVRYEG